MSTPDFQTRQMPKGAGKAHQTTHYVDDLVNQGRINGVLILPRYEIETGSIANLLTHVGPETTGQGLRDVAGKTLLSIEGYDESEEEIYEIPEIRTFFQVHCREWSPWLFLGTIFSADLFAFVLCCLPSVSCLRKDSELIVGWRTQDMHEFLNRSLPTAAWLHHQAGVGKKEGCAMLKAAAAYLGLPFPEERP